MPPARRRPKPKPAPRPSAAGQDPRPPLRPSWKLRLPQLEQRHFDVIGLGLVAHRDLLRLRRLPRLGRRDRPATPRSTACASCIGAVHYLVPAALMAAGAILVLRPVLPAVRPFAHRRASACSSALTLALRRRHARARPRRRHGRLGRRSGSSRAAASWGRALYYVTSTFLGTLGAHTIALFLLAAAVLLLTGASIAGVIKATTDSFATHDARGPHRRARAAARATEELVRARAGPAAARRPRSRARSRGRGDAARRARRRRGPHASRTSATRPRRCPSSRRPRASPRTRRSDEPGVARTDARPRGPHAPGPLPRDGHRLPRLRVDAARHRLPQALERRREQARHRRPGEGRRPADRGARPLRRRGQGHRHGRRARTSRATSCASRPGIKVAKVAQLKDDLAYALAATDIRILAPIPGKQAVGVEVPNARRRIVHLGDVLQETPAGWSPLTVWLGKDVAGRAIGADLAKMPHLLVAGTTGAGKSGCVNAMLASRPARAPRRTSCGSCSSTPSRSSSTTTTRSRTCSRR